jgi:photosystem II stability/assembly factor-like uncharacterized protein
MRRSTIIPFAAVCAVLLTAPAEAQNAPRQGVTGQPFMASVDPALFRGMSFRSVGPPRGGRVTTVTGVPSQPRTFYMGVASGGLFKTTDNGATWVPISETVPVGSMGSIAVADSDPNILYLGTGSDGVRSNVSTGRGVYRSNDAGKTWQFIGLYNVGQIGAVRIHPTNPDIAWVAANGDIFKPTPDRGIYKTIDGGKSWKKTLFVSDSTGAMDVELQPGNPNVVYAWMSRIERKPWTIISGALREGGFYKSTDGGETWREIINGLPNELIGKGNLAVTAANPNRIYALIEAAPAGGVYRPDHAGMYRSDDAGQTWTRTNHTAGMIQRPFYYTTLGADPTNADVVYGGAESFYKSTDGGKTFTTMRTPHGDNHDIWVNPTNGRIMVQANDGGANVSTDGGATWSTQMNQVTAEIYGVWVDNKFPYNLYGAQQDNSTIIMPATANPLDAESFESGPGCETGPILPHPTKPHIVYGSCKGQYEVFNAISGTTRPYWVGGQSLYGNSGRDLILRFQRTSPMETSPHDPDVLYYGSQHVHRTRDLGVTWETISPDLTWFPPHAQDASGTPITRDVTGEEFYSTLYAIRESLKEPGVIWTGANDGPFHVTRDNGRTWTNITPKDLPPGGRVQFIEPSPHRAGSAYYAVYRYLLGDYKPYIYRTDNYGQSWTLLTPGNNGIPADAPTRVVREDPSREGLLYAGTEFGMYISFNNGANWQPFQLNLPYTPITDIKVHRKDLVISTQGRAFWIFDNLSALHQITPQIATQQAHLFKPRDGYRTRVAPHLYGPMVEYYLPTAPSEPVTIEILTQGGELIGSFSSANQPAAPPRPQQRAGGDDPDEAMMEGRRGAQQQQVPLNRVTANAGVNRFVWNVQRPIGLQNQQLPAPPGQYQVRLKVGSVTQTQPFNVLVDPNIAAEGITVADLVEQYEHNVRVAQLTAAVAAARQRIAQGRQRLADGTPQRRQLEALSAKIETEPVRYGKPGLQAHVSYLAGMTRGPDMKIGRDAISRYNTLKAELDAIVAELNRLVPPG